MTEAKKLYQNRRSVYILGKNLPISEQEVIEIIDNAVKYSPSAFNSNTAHAVVLLGDNHQKLWDITYAELAKFENATNNEYHKLVAQLLDSRIRAAYRLYPNNYIAYDLRYGTTKYKDCYTDEQKKVFMQHLQALEKYDTCDIENLKDIFLGIYSNPVNNK